MTYSFCGQEREIFHVTVNVILTYSWAKFSFFWGWGWGCIWNSLTRVCYPHSWCFSPLSLPWSCIVVVVVIVVILIHPICSTYTCTSCTTPTTYNYMISIFIHSSICFFARWRWRCFFTWSFTRWRGRCFFTWWRGRRWIVTTVVTRWRRRSIVTRSFTRCRGGNIFTRSFIRWRWWCINII